MSNITTRQTSGGAVITNKGSALTNAEIDSNFINLNTDKLSSTSNLSDLQNYTTARTNLSVDSSTQVMAKAVAMAIALG